MSICHLWSGRTLDLPSYTKERINWVVLPSASLFILFSTQPVHTSCTYYTHAFCCLARVIVRCICCFSLGLWFDWLVLSSIFSPYFLGGKVLNSYYIVVKGSDAPSQVPELLLEKLGGPPASGKGFPKLRVSRLVVVHMDCYHIVNCKDENSWKKITMTAKFLVWPFWNSLMFLNSDLLVEDGCFFHPCRREKDAWKGCFILILT